MNAFFKDNYLSRTEKVLASLTAIQRRDVLNGGPGKIAYVIMPHSNEDYLDDIDVCDEGFLQIADRICAAEDFSRVYFGVNPDGKLWCKTVPIEVKGYFPRSDYIEIGWFTGRRTVILGDFMNSYEAYGESQSAEEYCMIYFAEAVQQAAEEVMKMYNDYLEA